MILAGVLSSSDQSEPRQPPVLAAHSDQSTARGREEPAEVNSGRDYRAEEAATGSRVTGCMVTS